MDKGSKVTVNDVARMSGVSKGTVDRVLHNRGEVSAKSRDRVLKVIEELGYKPNVYASLLASRKEHRIVCMIPEFIPGEFWELTEKGICRGRDYASDYGISVDIRKYDQYSIESFQQACERTLASEPAGVIVAPLFRAETFKFVTELKNKGIPYIYIDSKLEDDNYLAYFGLPMYQSGYLSADMLTAGRDVRKVHVIRIARDRKGLSDPTVTRRTGFLDYMNEHYPDTEVCNVFIDPKDREEVFRILDKMFLDDPDPCKYIVMFNSRVHLVAEYLRERNVTTCRVVGFDVLEKNLSALRDGFVQLLIAQHSDSQTALAVSSLADWLVLGKPIHKKDNYTQMDILCRYNCDYYL